MIRRILVPLDGSELAEGVLPYVANLARPLKAEVTFVQAVCVLPLVPPVEPSTGQTIIPCLSAPESVEKERRAAEDYLSRLADAWRAKGLDVKCAVVLETPAPGIVEYARSHGVDLIAMSTHGRSGLSRLVFGSVAEQVVREAGLPVLLVRPQQKTTKRSRPPER